MGPNSIVYILIFILISCTKKEEAQAIDSSVDSQKVNVLSKEFIGKDYLIDDQHSYIGFKIKYFGFSPVRGRFNSFDGSIFYDPNTIENLRIQLIIDINSINTGESQRDDDLISEGSWFDEPNFPKAYFTSQIVKENKDGSFLLYGELTIKGTTKQVEIPFDKATPISRDWAQNEQVDFSGKLTINRQDFGIYGGDFWSSVMENGLTQLSDDVELEIDIHSRRADYEARYRDMEKDDIRKIILDKISEEGIDFGLTLMNEQNKIGKITSGSLSTIAYVLMNRSKYKEAKEIFTQKLKLFGESDIVLNQLGIVSLKLNNDDGAKSYFTKANTLKENSRSRLYLTSEFEK